MIMFVYREEVYEPEKEEVKGMAEILIRKQRNGPIGSLKLTFLGANTRFENFSPELAAARQFQGNSNAAVGAPSTQRSPAGSSTEKTVPGKTPDLENF